MSDLAIIDILHDTTVDGPGFRTAIYAAGCQHACLGCHNPQSWSKENGNLFSVEHLFRVVCENEFAHVTFTGGEPLLQVEGFSRLAQRIKEETLKTIWCYTGYTYEQILQSEHLSSILPYIDVLVDGRFMIEYKDLELPFRGSSNQRIINVNQSQKAGHLVLL
ncbi:MAG: anaerobic ribonucleoside-triphosphate reductase activating protein [Mangrovibacterium sp.]